MEPWSCDTVSPEVPWKNDAHLESRRGMWCTFAVPMCTESTVSFMFVLVLMYCILFYCHIYHLVCYWSYCHVLVLSSVAVVVLSFLLSHWFPPSTCGFKQFACVFFPAQKNNAMGTSKTAHLTTKKKLGGFNGFPRSWNSTNFDMSPTQEMSKTMLRTVAQKNWSIDILIAT